MDHPIANWPEGYVRNHKVVQIFIDGRPYLRFERRNLGLHAFILENVLNEFGVEFENITFRDRTESYEIPSPKGARYNVVGMGRADISPATKHVRMHDNSYNYNIGIDKNHLNEIKNLLPGWTFKFD